MVGDEPSATPAKAVALVLALVYVLAAFAWQGVEDALKALLACMFILACIWFPEAMSSMTGGRITRPSSPGWVSAVAWFLLILPAAVWLIAKLAGADVGP